MSPFDSARRRWLRAAAGVAVAAVLPPADFAPAAFAQSPHTHQHDFRDAEHWARAFDDPKRDAWQKPHEVIRALALPPGATVADIGAGTGYFSVRLAHMLPRGTVWALDVEPAMVRHLEQRARSQKLPNLKAAAMPADAPTLPAPVDLALLVDVYHHIEQRERWFGALRAALKPGGRVAVIDFRRDATIGPPPDARIAPEQVIAELAAAGYALQARHEMLPQQYFLVFVPRG